MTFPADFFLPVLRESPALGPIFAYKIFNTAMIASQLSFSAACFNMGNVWFAFRGAIGSVRSAGVAYYFTLLSSVQFRLPGAWRSWVFPLLARRTVGIAVVGVDFVVSVVILSLVFVARTWRGRSWLFCLCMYAVVVAGCLIC